MLRIALRLIALLALIAPARASALPPIKHVFVIWMENKNYDQTFAEKDPKAPYFAKTLPTLGALLPEYYGVAHHSLANYIAVVSGQGPNPETQADAPIYKDVLPGVIGGDGQAMGTGSVYPASVKTIANQLDDKGLEWKGYMEDMRTPCRHPEPNQPDPTQNARPDDQYAARHNPFVYFHSVVDTPGCRQNDVDLNSLPGDISQVGTTANFVFITPDLCADGHDDTCADGKSPAGLAGIDAFLREWVPKILASAGFRDDGLLVVSFDEADDDNSACCGEKAANTPAAGGESGGPGGGKVGAVLISPFIKPGTVDKTPYNHYSFLRGVEDLFGVPHLGYAGVDGLEPLGPKLFNQTPVLGLKVKAKRRNRNHVRFAIDTGRTATVAFGGACAAASRTTSELGALTVTVRQKRGGHCRVSATRDAWQPATRGFRLRAPR